MEIKALHGSLKTVSHLIVQWSHVANGTELQKTAAYWRMHRRTRERFETVSLLSTVIKDNIKTNIGIEYKNVVFFFV